MTPEHEHDIWRGAAPRPRCSLGVGCDEMGICYAEAHGAPENCPHYRAEKYPRRGLMLVLAVALSWALIGAAVYALTVASS